MNQYIPAQHKFTPHFSASEFSVSATAKRLQLDNQIPSTMNAQCLFTCEQMEKVRSILGDVPVFILSAYRSPKVNRAVGGSPTSDHRHGRAVDFRAPAFGSPTKIVRALAAALEEDLIDFDQLILEFPNRGAGAWVHIGFRDPKDNRRQILTKKDGKPYLQGIIE